MRCKKCGALGYRSDGCGTSHTTLTSPAPAAETASTPSREKAACAPAPSILTAIPKVLAPRVKLSPAELEAAKQRIAAKRAAEALRDAPPQRSRPPPEDDEPVLPIPENPTLPTPRSSWGLDGDYVRELGEPIKRRRGRPRKAELERDLTP